ncbi:MAG: hypothetical protein JXR82_08740 [Marinifilaceae bacterium]|nr:hypothetical protein [Marinifilaceae bacterium]
MITHQQVNKLRTDVLKFINDRKTNVVGEYNYSSTGAPTLYSSCYALMTLHYLGQFPLDTTIRSQWAEYISQWQNEGTGYFIGPELRTQEINDAKHDLLHLKLHLTTTILPCLELLGIKTKWKLSFADEYLNKNRLTEWLSRRDWTDSWLEGNNLLFILQILIYCRDIEKHPEAQARIEQLFTWLDNEIDTATGLWGTNGHCSHQNAMCGGYHQLLAYYYEHHPIQFPEKLVDTTLALQHADGGFHPSGGGGACEDVDAVDILVNLYKLYDYRRPEIRHALRKALNSIISKQMTDGGFVYRANESFSHMGMVSTYTPPNHSNMFATWFRIHTIALISEILTDTALTDFSWKFNKSLSMGWHNPWDKKAHRLSVLSSVDELRCVGMLSFITVRTSPEHLRTLRWYRARLIRAIGFLP